MTTETKMPDPRTMTKEEAWALLFERIESLSKRVAELEWEVNK